MSGTLVLLRHGQSQWNLDNRFTGWVDVDITDKGREEAVQAGQQMSEEGLQFDVVHTSLLKRAIRTMWTALDVMDQMWVPVQRSWRLNERHYGGLQGLNKAETTEKHGEEQVLIWRRSYDIPPPEMSREDEGHPCNDVRYTHLDPEALPGTESLATTLERVLPYWHDAIAPDLRAGKTVLVAAHGNSLRALVMYLENIPKDEITSLNIPTGVPRVYRFDNDFKVTEARYLGDADAVAAAAEAVANQAKAG